VTRSRHRRPPLRGQSRSSGIAARPRERPSRRRSEGPEPTLHTEDVLYTKYGLEVWYVSRCATKVSRERGRLVVLLTHSPAVGRMPQPAAQAGTVDVQGTFVNARPGESSLSNYRVVFIPD
jgi:hypothetical protein